ncbi:MAG: hypothetical protein HYR67_03530 [Bacteroidetes bacterium]|nr:hypothetical protein [Bacteroidota bacterium]
MTLSASAQQSDTTKSKSRVSDTSRLPLNNINSLSEKNKKKIERINSRLEKVHSKRLKAPKIKKVDSVQSATQGVLNKPGEAEQRLLNKSKSVEKKVTDKLDAPKEEVATYNQKVQVLQKHFKHHLDSLGKLQVKDAHVTKTMDSLKKKMNHLKEAKSIKDVKRGEEKLAKSGLNSKVKGFESKVNKELSAMNLGNVKVPNLNVPNLKVPNVSLPGVSTTLPNSNLGLNTSLPNVSVPSLGNATIPNGNLPVNGIAQANAPSMPSTSASLPGNLLPSKELKELPNIQKEAGQITKATSEISKAQGEIKNLNSDNLEKTLEKDAQNIKEVKQLSGEAAQVEQYKKMVEKWESDPEYRKELAVTKAKEQAINHFAGQEKQLMAAMQQLTNVKTKYKDYEGVLDMFKKPGNAMKGKPFIERLRPGFNLQFQSKHEVMLDFNPQVGYRISGRLTAGFGWNERWGYDFNKWKYISNDHVYGPRAYMQVKIKTGIYALVTPEAMNALVPPSFNSTDPGTKKWVWTWMAGLKKEFRYSKNMLGSLQVMYNLLDKHNQSPYVSKLNIRMGFEFPLQKKK